MLFGLLISPISWTHHWVWMLPLVMWLVLGSMRARTRFLGWAWVVLAYVGSPWLVTFASDSGWLSGRPWYAELAARSTCSRRWRRWPTSPSSADDPIDVACHRDVLVGDPALGMRDECESHCPPTDVDVGMMILAFRVLADAADGVDPVEKCGELHRSAQGPVGVLPARRDRAARRPLDRRSTQPSLDGIPSLRAEPDRRRGRTDRRRRTLAGGPTRTASGTRRTVGTARRQGGAGGEPTPRRWCANSTRNSASRSPSGRGSAPTCALSETMTLRAYLVTQTGGSAAPARPSRAALGDRRRTRRARLGARRPRLAPGSAVRGGATPEARPARGRSAVAQ